jgi:hypothetical protein
MRGHPFSELPDRGKAPASARALNHWVAQAVEKTGLAEGRVGWIIASSVVVAAVQRALGDDQRPLILLKGGTLIEMELGLRARATADVDTLYRGDFGSCIDTLDEVLKEPWGPITFQRTSPETITNARRTVKPLRFDVKLLIGSRTWRSLAVEVSPDEGRAGASHTIVDAPRLAHFGLPEPDHLVGLTLDYQVAQKLHACTDPHLPPEFINDRARDIVDLHLLRDAFYSSALPPASLAAACRDLFETRYREAEALGDEPRSWPPEIRAYPSWEADFSRACEAAGIVLDLSQEVSALNGWIDEIDAR